MTPARLLVAAKRLHPDATSEGICTAKFVCALVDDGWDVSVLTSDESTDRTGLLRSLPWLGEVDLHHHRTVPRRATPKGRAGQPRPVERAWVVLDFVSQARTGYPAWYRSSIRRWRRVLRDELRREPPLAVVTRAAGTELETHLAMGLLDPAVPWIANYHDPYPPTRFPAPYTAEPSPAMMRREEDHEAVLARADALTFPSTRLRDWVVGARAELLAKSHVVPHVAGPGADGTAPVAGALPDPFGGRPFTLVHTGTLLKHRRVDSLLEGLDRFALADTLHERSTRLVLAGPLVGGKVPADPCLVADLEARGLLAVLPTRLGYGEALALVRGATAAIVVEAPSPESPFFPAKLADYAWLGRTVLALSPRESVASDLMGADHPLRVDPADPTATARALDRLWEATRAGDTAALAIPEVALATLRPTVVAARFSDVLATVLGRSGR